MTGKPAGEDRGRAGRPENGPAVAIAGGASVEMGVRQEDVRSALSTVIDPEVSMSIVDLGLIYEIQVSGGHVRITMTLTTPGCPLHETITEWARNSVHALPGVESVDITLTFDPPWTPSRVHART